MANISSVTPVIMPAETYEADGNQYANPAAGGVQSPLLTPNWGQRVIVAGGQAQLLGTAAFLKTFPRVAATVACTIGGSYSSGDVVTLTFTSPVFPGGAIAVAYALLVGDNSAAIVADRIAGAVNGNSQCQSFGISASTNGAGVITFSEPGPVANYTVASAATTGSETFTFNPVSGDFSGGSGPVIPWKDFTLVYQGQQHIFRTGAPKSVDPGLASVLVNEGHAVV
jgi:hypothetical protein